MRGSAHFAAMAASMFARRALGQSLAREFGPRGVHVAHAVVDGVIDVPRTQAYGNVNGGVEDGKLSAEAVCFSLPLPTPPLSLYVPFLRRRFAFNSPSSSSDKIPEERDEKRQNGC